jgi:hypothetical protein
MDEEPEKRIWIAKEDISALIVAVICLALTTYLFFGPSPIKSLLPEKPQPPAAEAHGFTPKPVQGMMPASAEPAEAEKPESSKK